MSKITLRELEGNNGQEGKPCYVAVNGEVYEISGSSLWENGAHMDTHQAGRDLTESLADAPHGTEVLEAFRKVGELERRPQITEPQTPRSIPGWALAMLSLHSHPICAHFPQALFVFAPLFLALFYISAEPSFERTAYHLMVSGFLMAIPATASGFVHWLYKYGGRSRPVFRLKIVLSLLLLPLSGLAVAVHTAHGNLDANTVNWAILLLYVLMVPVIVLLGRAGGLIVFSGKGR